jgi:hypothetical protein
MFNNIKRVAAVIALTGWMGVANASLIFDFSYGTTGNELVGEIKGLDDFIDGQSQKAETITFTIATGIYAEFQNIQFDVADNDANISFNNIVVFNKQITYVYIGYKHVSAKFYECCGGTNYPITYRFQMYGLTDLYLYRIHDRTPFIAPESDFNGFVNRVAPTPAPEPSAVFLLALGLAGVSFSRYKKKS